jgi:hypothetical protein
MQRVLKSHGGILLILSTLCMLSGLVMLGYANQLVPLLLSETETRTETSCIPETNVMRSTSVFLTTTGKSLHVLTYTTTSVSISQAGPSCPYGGTYYSVKCTSLCGCQHDVCITFDYNCANDYPAVHSVRTALQVVRATTASTEFLVQTRTDVVNLTITSTACREALVEETVVREVSNPNISNFRTLATVLIVAGICGLLGGFWARSRSVRKKKITFRTIYFV